MGQVIKKAKFTGAQIACAALAGGRNADYEHQENIKISKYIFKIKK